MGLSVYAVCGPRQSARYAHEGDGIDIKIIRARTPAQAKGIYMQTLKRTPDFEYKDVRVRVLGPTNGSVPGKLEPLQEEGWWCHPAVHELAEKMMKR